MSDVDHVLERSAEFWGEALVRVSYALGVAQHVRDDQQVQMCR